MEVNSVRLEQKIYKAYQGLKGKKNEAAMQESTQLMTGFLLDGLQNPDAARKAYRKAFLQTSWEINDAIPLKKGNTFENLLYNCYAAIPKKLFQQLKFSNRMDEITTFNSNNEKMLYKLNKKFNTIHPTAKERRAVKRQIDEEVYNELMSGNTIKLEK